MVVGTKIYVEIGVSGFVMNLITQRAVRPVNCDVQEGNVAVSSLLHGKLDFVIYIVQVDKQVSIKGP
jgi:hypothetical protein